MSEICPTITAYEPHGYRAQMEQIEPFAKRIHIDLMDQAFTGKASPGLDQVWWPEHITADIHLMYQNPMEELDQLIQLKPNLVVIHFEADVNHQEFTEQLHEAGIKAGLALLQNTSVDEVADCLKYYDHALVFSGNLGEHGGEADLRLLDKVKELRSAKSELEISWDGGISDKNAKVLINAGIDVLNAGGFIQKAENPVERYKLLVESIA
jgi:ribulose-phosphate 3-epimerase